MKPKANADTTAAKDAKNSETPDIPDVVVEPRNPKAPDIAETKDAQNSDKKGKDDEDKHPKTRIVLINDKPKDHFSSNRVKTSKYSIFTFVPFFFYEQFRRASNIFFLLMAILQQIPNVSPTGRYTTAMPLAFIMCISAIKEFLEDVKRHKADATTNSQEVLVLRDAKFVPIKWKEITVGDFVKLKSEKFVPADLVLYSTSEPLGMCYIETANLDGETNLKLRQALPRTAEMKTEAEIAALKGHIECGIPNRMIYEFAGSLNFESEARPYSLGPDQLVLRGAKLRNTKWIIGQAIYTGHETKLLKNSTKAPLKRSTLDKATNSQIEILFVALILISAMSCILYSVNDIPEYVGNPHADALQKFLQFLTFILLYNNLIPISLSVTLECVRFVQALFINWDDDIYHAESKTAAQARTSNLNEELGQIRYIFSDKTGTLTRNIMEFKGCSVGGTLFPFDTLFPNAAKGTEIKDDVTGNPLVQQIKGGNTNAEEFLLALALCHYVIPELQKNEDGSEELIYNAASPDERALVEGAQKFGYIFVSRTPASVEISVQGDTRIYEVLNLIEFTSTRKRMTVILKCPDGKIRLYCKGADSVILERVVTKSQKEQTELKTTEEHLEHFATEGLRTLCVAMKVLSEEEHKTWNIGFQKAISSVLDRENAVGKSAELIEKNLTLVGSTAIEDKLQDFVPETIASFLEAGISVWVLTGDKQETAINIGNSCRLINGSMAILIINQENEDETLACILEFAKKLNVDLEDMKKKGKKAFNNIIPVNAAVVIDGKTLAYALADKVRTYFLSLCCSCMAAIVCRAAPMQKAEIVEYVTKLTGAVTLAIGDGANDVAMIQKAHVGIGLSGNEGLQAACASDYSIAQFSYLKKLLFVHGAWNHDRITKAIFYSFYKNITLYIIELWFAIDSAWSGQIIFDRWAITAYNLVFVCMQPMAIGLFEQNCSMKLRMKYPHLYLKTSHGAFSVKNFSIWMITALVHSMLLYWLTNQFYSTHSVPSSIWEEGKEGSYLVLGNSIYTYVVVVVSLKMGLVTRAWTKFTHFALWGSIGLWFAFLTVYSFIFTFQDMIGNDVLDMAEQLYTSPAFWISLIVIPSVTLLPDLIYAAIMGTLFKTEPDIYREQEIRNEQIARRNTFHLIEEKTKKGKGKVKVDGDNTPTVSKPLPGKPKQKTGKKKSLASGEPPRTTSNNPPESTKVSMEPPTEVNQKIKPNGKDELNEGEAVSLQRIEPVGPRVMRYSPVDRKIITGDLHSISHKVDEDPDIDARPRPPMMEVLRAMYPTKLELEEKKKASIKRKKELESRRVMRYCPIQKQIIMGDLHSISHKVDEDPEIDARRRPTMMEIVRAMCPPDDELNFEEKKDKGSPQPKEESASAAKLPPHRDDTDIEGNAPEEPKPQKQETKPDDDNNAGTNLLVGILGIYDDAV